MKAREAPPVFYYGENIETVKIFLDRAAAFCDSPFKLEEIQATLEKVAHSITAPSRRRYRHARFGLQEAQYSAYKYLASLQN